MPAVKSELDTFDGLDNRREVMILLDRLGSDERRARFLLSLVPASATGFANVPAEFHGRCDAVTAYFMLVAVCNEVGVSVNEAARRLDRVVSRPTRRATTSA